MGFSLDDLNPIPVLVGGVEAGVDLVKDGAEVVGDAFTGAVEGSGVW
jgi:hypothetical protein